VATDALDGAKLRRGGEQKVTVEHVHVYPGGQAIVGSVTHSSPEGGRGPLPAVNHSAPLWKRARSRRACFLPTCPARHSPGGAFVRP
jgi:hypothetical protein